MGNSSRPFSEDELLAHVRGAAPSDLSDRIDAQAARDPDLRAEIAVMRGLKPALVGDDAGNPPGEFGWRRLEAEIRKDQAASRSAVPQPRVALWRAAAVIFGLAVLGQGAFIATTVNRAPDEAVYRTASDPTGRHVLGVSYKPDATVADIDALLRDAHARTIDGPSALGLYRIAFESAEAMRAGRAKFEASGLVDLIAEE
ncbi:MAG: hypothetical protein KDJ77_20035 [Rhodobiaceae bacterium]|nr:hypothetical protein [Rhodobiaceae bacterium]